MKFTCLLLPLCLSILPLVGSSAVAEESTSIQGKVMFTGKVPAARKLLLNKDPDICGHGYREMNDVEIGESGGLKNVVVFLDSSDLEFSWKHPEEGYTLNQEGCRFLPFIQIFPKDTKARLRIVNSDPTLHNVRISQKLGRVKPTLLNIAQPNGMGPKEKALRLKKGSNIVEIKCDAHDFMEGWMFAADNPYCALGNKDGDYVISDLPAGEYTFKAWHPYLGTLSRVIQVEEGKSLEVNFVYSEKVSD